MVKDNTTEKNSVLYKLRQQGDNANLRPRSKQAWDFYLSKIKSLRTPLRKSPGFQGDTELLPISKVQSGMLIYFGYDAITESLPFWDAYPMDLVIDYYVDSNNGRAYMTAINFHYLPIMVRYRVMIKLIEQYGFWNMDNRNVKSFPKVNYYAIRDLLASYGFSFAYKKYLVSQITTNIYQIPITYISEALSLDTADWQNGYSNNSVWSNYTKNALTGKW